MKQRKNYQRREVRLNANKVKTQLIIGCISLVILIILGSIQVVFSPISFVRGGSLIGIIICSACIGAFIREMFIFKKTNY